MWKGSKFSDWNGEQLASICQITEAVEIKQSGVHSSFDRSELYLSTEDQSWKCCWKQEEDGSGQALLSLLGCFL